MVQFFQKNKIPILKCSHASETFPGAESTTFPRNRISRKWMSSSRTLADVQSSLSPRVPAFYFYYRESHPMSGDPGKFNILAIEFRSSGISFISLSMAYFREIYNGTLYVDGIRSIAPSSLAPNYIAPRVCHRQQLTLRLSTFTFPYKYIYCTSGPVNPKTWEA